MRPMGRESGFRTWFAASLELAGWRGSSLGFLGGVVGLLVGSGALEGGDGGLGVGLGCDDV